MKELWIDSEEEMVALGKAFGKGLKSERSVIALVGEVGAGKTHFTKGIAQSLGGAGAVTSPTFTLVNEIEVTAGNLFHFDFYRIKAVEELYELGWYDYLDNEGVVVVEWADLYTDLIPETAQWIKIEHHGDRRRVLIA